MLALFVSLAYPRIRIERSSFLLDGRYFYPFRLAEISDQWNPRSVADSFLQVQNRDAPLENEHCLER